MTADELQDIGIIAIVRTNAETDLLRVSEALAEGGVRAMEITLPTPGALDAIKLIREKLSTALRIGAGTVLDAADARAAYEAGAEFIVTPTLQPDTVAFCREYGLPIACGCFTPTEALAAHRAGADFIKLFPADTLGPAYVRALLAPLPFLKIMPTGGVSRDNLASWLQAGAVGVGLGSGLVPKDALRHRDWPALTAAARAYVQALADARAALINGDNK